MIVSCPAQRCLSGLMVAVLAPLGATASASEAEAAPAAPDAWTFHALVAGEHTGAADLGDHDGSLAVDTLVYEARAFWRPALGTQLGIGLGGGYWDYEGSRLDDEPTLRAHRLRIGGLQMLSPHWGVIAQEALGVASDLDTSNRDAFTTTTFAGPVWRRDRDLFIAGGIYLTTARNYRKTIPMISVWWRIDDAWSLEIFDQIDNLSRLTWRGDASWSLGLRVDVQHIQFALDQGEGARAGGFRDTHATVGLECDWRPLGTEAITIRPHAGVALARQIAFTDADGEEIFKDKMGAAPAFGLTAKAVF